MASQQVHCIGWDVGGAHLKAVAIDAQGQVVSVRQLYCPLWKGLHILNNAVDEVLQQFQAHHHAVTMTGELADIFDHRQQGVLSIAQLMAERLSGRVEIFAGKRGFIHADDAEKYYIDVASMNWLASAMCVAENNVTGLFADIGSTTTDLICMQHGQPLLMGCTDLERMQSGALVYSGVIRTPLMALVQKIEFTGKQTYVAAEYFATAADVYTLTGELSGEDNSAETADGEDKSKPSCARRLARMVGCDLQDASMADWMNLAQAFRMAQLKLVEEAMQRQLMQLDNQQEIQMVGAGVGSFLAADIAKRLGVKFQPVSAMIAAENSALKRWAEICFPAYAIATLYRKKQNH